MYWSEQSFTSLG